VAQLKNETQQFFEKMLHTAVLSHLVMHPRKLCTIQNASLLCAMVMANGLIHAAANALIQAH
jgi:hypothetical protein